MFLLWDFLPHITLSQFLHFYSLHYTIVLTPKCLSQNLGMGERDEWANRSKDEQINDEFPESVRTWLLGHPSVTPSPSPGCVIVGCFLPGVYWSYPWNCPVIYRDLAFCFFIFFLQDETWQMDSKCQTMFFLFMLENGRFINSINISIYLFQFIKFHFSNFNFPHCRCKKSHFTQTKD